MRSRPFAAALVLLLAGCAPTVALTAPPAAKAVPASLTAEVHVSVTPPAR